MFENKHHEFNLIKHVKQKKRLSAQWFIAIIVLALIALAATTIYSLSDAAMLKLKITKIENLIRDDAPKLDRIRTSSGKENDLRAVLPQGYVMDNKGFYDKLSDLSHVVVDGVWINTIIVNSEQGVFKLEGKTLETASLDKFFTLLKNQDHLGKLNYRGLDISSGKLPELSYEAKKQAKNLKMPRFFTFVIQTEAMKPTLEVKRRVLI